MLNENLYAQRLQKLIYLHLPTDCFMKISLHSTGEEIVGKDLCYKFCHDYTGLPNLYAPWWQTRELKVAGKKVGKSLFSYKNDEWCMLFIC